MTISNMAAGVGAGGNVDVQPAAGHAYKIIDVGNNAAFVANVPDVQVGIRDAVLADAILLLDPTTDPGRRVNQLEVYITNGNYLRITNTGGAGSNISYFGEEVNVNNVRADLVAVGAGVFSDIQPPDGEVWKITAWGYSVFTAGPADINPDCIVGQTDGTLVASVIIDQTMVRGQDKKAQWIIDHNNYLRVTDGTAGAGGVFGYSGIRIPQTCISDVQDAIAGGNIDIRPAINTEWVITEIGAELWAGAGAPNNYPEIQVSMIVGANLSEILEGGGVSTPLRWNSEMNLSIDYTHYLRVTNLNGGAANEVAWMGYLRRSYS